jgi:pimeloyl-ACP methyl ester carboxylesterase
MGWGFSQLRGITEFSAAAKREYLFGFWKNVLKGRKMVLVGASLGGAAAVDFAHTYPEAVEKLVLIDAQVIDECIL